MSWSVLDGKTCQRRKRDSSKNEESNSEQQVLVCLELWPLCGHTFTFMRSSVLSPFSLLGLLCTNPTLMMGVEVSVEYVDLFKYIVVIVFLFEICLD